MYIYIMKLLYTACSQDRLDWYENLTQLAKLFTEINAMKQNSKKCWSSKNSTTSNTLDFL